MRTSGVRAGAAAVLVVLAAGCSNAEPSVAAYVGPEEISDTRVTTATGEVTAALGRPVPRTDVLTAMIHGIVSERLAAENNITITDAERTSALADSPLVTRPAAKEIGYDLADQQIVLSKIGEEAYVNAMRALTVTVNPRYGTLDPTNLAVVDLSNSLSKAAPEQPAVP